MSSPATTSTDTDRQRLLDELDADYGPNWKEQNKPGSFGCHELLDRTALAVDFVDRYVLSHPACVQNQEWFALADQAMTLLHTLYQQVGAAHMEEDASAKSDD